MFSSDVASVKIHPPPLVCSHGSDMAFFVTSLYPDYPPLIVHQYLIGARLMSSEVNSGAKQHWKDRGWHRLLKSSTLTLDDIRAPHKNSDQSADKAPWHP